MHGIKREKLNYQAGQLKLKRDKAKIEHYNNLKDRIIEKRSNGLYTIDELKLTTEIISLNPEFYTMWNYRREILLELFKDKSHAEITDSLNHELVFTLAQFKKNSKCYWIWNHRVWCLVNAPLADWDYEFKIVEGVLVLDARNFHGWQYRRFIVSSIEAGLLEKGETEKLAELSLKEFDYTTKMIKKNISNFSSWHNRTKLIPKLLKNPPANHDIFQDPLKLLKSELEILKHAFYTDSDDSSIWLYLRWLLTTDELVKNIKAEVFIEILNQQLALIQELDMLEEDDNGIHNKWCLQSIVLLKDLISKVDSSISNNSKESLKILVEVDPLRAERYLELIEN